MNTGTLDKVNFVVDLPLDDIDFGETTEDIAEFEDIFAHPERHKGYRTAGEMLRDMGLL